jgi:hypothetical protein
MAGSTTTVDASADTARCGAWSDRELIGANTRFEVTSSEPTESGAVVEIEVTSDGFNGYSRFTFDVEGKALRSMTIMA